ncbi:MAG: DUF6398 domain-containing protein [Methanomicrobiales archaeon]|nr:DUF6398 domain-containing protein [Methanomicrobiales archaeon]
MGTDREKVAALMDELILLTDDFCDHFLNEEYKEVMKRLIQKMARKRQVPFLSGTLRVWAAGVVHAVGMASFAFDRSKVPHIAAGTIYEHFGVSNASALKRSSEIRKMFKMSYWDPEFSIPSVAENHPLRKLVLLPSGFIMPISVVRQYEEGREDREGTKKPPS